MLGVLLALLFVAVLLALWFLIVDNGESSSSSANQSGQPTPLVIPTSTPRPSSISSADNTTTEATTADTVDTTAMTALRGDTGA